MVHGASGAHGAVGERPHVGRGHDHVEVGPFPITMMLGSVRSYFFLPKLVLFAVHSFVIFRAPSGL